MVPVIRHAEQVGSSVVQKPPHIKPILRESTAVDRLQASFVAIDTQLVRRQAYDWAESLMKVQNGAVFDVAPADVEDPEI